MRIETYGTVDELNSLLGVCRSLNTVQEIDTIFEEIQTDLFTLGADLATPADATAKSVRRIQHSNIANLEKHIDDLEPLLVTLDSFILPGGNRTASMIHFARTVCRRAERRAVHLSHEDGISSETIIYLNRLSDLLFVMARRVNALSNTNETKWEPGRS